MLALVAAIWVAVALALTLTGAITAAPFLVPVSAGGAIAAGVVAYRRGGALREIADRIDLRWPVLLHALRAPIGVKILADTGAGIIPPLFGDRA